MGRPRNRGRDVSGIVLLDKPAGITSNAALQQVKRLFHANKAGHTGSLDPIATGLLPICLGEATKMSAFLIDADKAYRATLRLGIETNTGDNEGETVASWPVNVSQADLDQALSCFVGEIAQVPPMFSAIKQGGQPLYKLAHQGIEVERESRHVTIYRLEFLARRGDDVEIDVHCSKGTYIRTLAEDIGRRLGCGAHLVALRRTLAGPFRLEDAHTLETLAQRRETGGMEALDACLLPPDTALQALPEVILSDDMAFFVRRGQAVLVPRLPAQGLVRLYAGPGKFIGVGHVLDDGRVAPKRLIVA